MNCVRCSERRLRDGSRMHMMGAATTDWRRGREAEWGIANLALVLDGNVVGDFWRGGGLKRRRLPNGVILGGGWDGDDTGLDDGRGVIVDDGLRLV